MDLRYQAVVLNDQVSSAIQVQSISWKRSISGDPAATFYDFKIYMGYSNLDQLGMTFLDNYMPGTRTLVFSSSPYNINVGPNEWLTTTLNTPFWYSPAIGNLLIEVEWTSESFGSVYMWHYNAGTDRAIKGAYGSPTAYASENTLPHIMLNGVLDLEPESFGSIKASFQ
ncbi:hypothetical protein GX411_04320 [Candidatus Fermentibacteria bacterium]|nr:hypothetical protein [Candidatus Fermentibacteria bacterium]